MSKKTKQANDEARFRAWTQQERVAHLRKMDKQINRQCQIRGALHRVIKENEAMRATDTPDGSRAREGGVAE